MSDLYEADILIWSQQQAALLRRLARGERVNDADLDWSNIAEEVESVGRSELAAVRALLRQSLAHLLKAEAWPEFVYAVRWRLDAEQFRIQAADRFATFNAAKHRSRKALPPGPALGSAGRRWQATAAAPGYLPGHAR